MHFVNVLIFIEKHQEMTRQPFVLKIVLQYYNHLALGDYSIARSDTTLEQSEHVLLYNHLSSNKYIIILK